MLRDQNLETRETLIEARALIEDPKHWTQGTMQTTVRGGPFGSRSITAYCAVGAIAKVRGGVLKIDDCLVAFWPIVGGIMGYNDGSSHECVLQAFDAAIESLTPPVPDSLPCGAEVALV